MGEMTNHKKSKYGLVLSGGGARGAYEAGVLHFIRTEFARLYGKHIPFDILCGSSVGAINACYLASSAHDLTFQGNRIYEVWNNLKQEDVYRRDIFNFAKFISRSASGILRNLFYKNDEKAAKNLKNRKHFKGFLDTKPLIPFLQNHISWKQISLNIKNNLLDAVSVTMTNVLTGKLELFIEKHPDTAYTGHYTWHDTKLEYYHAMASSAIPLIFPSVKVGPYYYMDGGVRANTPMSPAIQLGADKILVIGLHAEEESAEAHDHQFGMVKKNIPPPTMGTMVGKILSSIFLDKLDYDIEQMNRINRIIDWAEGCYGKDFLDKINRYLEKKRITGDVANRGLKKLSAMKIFPSVDVRDIFYDCVEKSNFFKKQLKSYERYMLRLMDVDLNSSTDFLSFIMFYPDYLHKLLELGYEDAKSHAEQLAEFFQID